MEVVDEASSQPLAVCLNLTAGEDPPCDDGEKASELPWIRSFDCNLLGRLAGWDDWQSWDGDPIAADFEVVESRRKEVTARRERQVIGQWTASGLTIRGFCQSRRVGRATAGAGCRPSWTASGWSTICRSTNAPVHAAAQRTKIGEEVTEQLDNEPAKHVIENVQIRYACSKCEGKVILAEKQFKTWPDMQAGQVLPKSPTGRAIARSRSRWAAFTRDTHGRVA